MCKKVFGPWLFILLSVISHAQYAGYKLLGDAVSFKTQFAAASQK